MAKKKSKQRKALDLALPIYQVKITLEHVAPPIWRRVQTNDCSLDELHDIIQAGMGWEDAHMYAFVIEGEEFGRSSEAEYDSRYVRLSEVAEEGHTRFRYDYDFGDDWQHAIDIEKTLPSEKGVRYPRCVKGARACPPEDCGGPYGYPYFLDKIQDPEHEEHDDALEWISGEFDPEEFDLDKVNEGLRQLRRWLGKRKGKHVLQAAFAKGDVVRVKPGIIHDQYPDIPVGGWVGKVKRIGWLTPIGYAVHWTKPTLDKAHPVFFKRCERDEMKPHKYWLDEDQLEAAADPTPVAMEQPTNLVTRSLSMDDPDDRIRMVFGLTGDDGLPKADEEMQRHFFDEEEDDVTESEFPIGTIVYYGPDDKVTTKIVAGVVNEEETEAIIERWVATDVTTNPKVQKEIERFFKKHGVTRVVISDGNMGCPHEEGKDFPVGGDCPFCPWWKGKQGSGAKE